MTKENKQGGPKSQKSKGQTAKRSAETYTGVIDITRSGMAFVVVEGLAQDIRVEPYNRKTALDGDQVKVKIIHGSGGFRRKEGKVISVLKRRNSSFTGGVKKTDAGWIVIPDQEVLPWIDIPEDKRNNAREGDKVVVTVTDWGDDRKAPSGEITDVLDFRDTNDTAMKKILVESGFPLNFPDEVMAESRRLPLEIPAEELARRHDMRQTFTVTIDPVDAKDFDDALSIQRMRNGHFEVGVHIADVSYYVRPGTALDDEAYKRATSVYLADRVLPMLPEKISNELCSLRPHEDKLTFSVLFEMTAEGEMLQSRIVRTVIHSNHRFTYEEVQEIIEKGEGLHDGEILTLNRMARHLRKKRIASGAINFTSQEVRFRLDENAFPIGVEIKESKEAHQLIEEFMLLANKAVAEAGSRIEIGGRPVPFPYRIHDVPDPEKLRLYVAFAAKLGYKFDVSSPEGIARSFNDMLAKVKGQPEQLVLEQLGIRTMSKAIYTTENIGHYGLGFQQYGHFTSPIRRYPDVMVHRILGGWLDKDLTPDKHMESKCRHCSDMERKAMEAERAANKYKQVEYMRQFIGEEFNGVISGVANFGFWVETLDAKCEGMVSITSLYAWDEFVYSDSDYALVGTHSHKRFRMGDTVRIRVLAANLEKRQLDYALVMEGGNHEEAERRAKARSGGGGGRRGKDKKSAGSTRPPRDKRGGAAAPSKGRAGGGAQKKKKRKGR